jgi:phosphatidylserine decarboxylase
MPIAREGWPIILSLLGLAALLGVLRWGWTAAICAVLALFVAFFFRDPDRAIPPGPGLVVSPADGRIVRIAPAGEPNPLGPGAVQLSIFLSIFDVHVNRAPIAGRIARVDYRPGEFLPAFDDKASLRNEQNSVLVEDLSGRVAFTQIAGLIARRIVFRKRVGDAVARGERVGLIKFGSRVDVFLPVDARLGVAHGQRVTGGVSVLAELR